MSSSSDGGAMAMSPTHLQALLDAKEKQLQLAGTLGQRILAQQMELEERIRQLGEDNDNLDGYESLMQVIGGWEEENGRLAGSFGVSTSFFDEQSSYVYALSPSATTRLRYLLSTSPTRLTSTNWPRPPQQTQLLNPGVPKTLPTARTTSVCGITYDIKLINSCYFYHPTNRICI